MSHSRQSANGRPFLGAVVAILFTGLLGEAAKCEDKEMLERMQNVEATSLGQTAEVIEKRFGKPRRIIDGRWFYDLAFKPTDVARTVGFQMEFNQGRVSRVFTIASETELAGIGSFAGHIGPEAMQVAVMESFMGSLPAKELTAAQRERFLKDALKRIQIAEEKHQTLELSTECPYGILLVEVIGQKDAAFSKLLKTKPKKIPLSFLKPLIEKIQ